MLEQFYRISNATGINMTIQPDGSILLAACKISVQNKGLDIEKKTSKHPSIESLKKEIDLNTPIALNICGKGILYKQSSKIEELSPNTFSQLLPNANQDDFYIQHFITGEQSFVSIIRKAEADKWIHQLTEAGFKILALSLGPFAVNAIIPQLNIYGEELVFDTHHIQRDEQGHWIKYQSEPGAKAIYPIKVETEAINEEILLPYAAAFQLVMGNQIQSVQADHAGLQKAFNHTQSNKKLQAYGGIILAVTFLLLLINFLVLTQLAASNTSLSIQLSGFTESSHNLKATEDSVKAKEALLQSLGWDGGLNKATFIDQLAANLPKEITWNELQINPPDQVGTDLQKKPVFKDRQIKLMGESANILPVNEWMARMKTKAWVKDIQLESYTFNTETNTGQFILTITY